MPEPKDPPTLGIDDIKQVTLALFALVIKSGGYVVLERADIEEMTLAYQLAWSGQGEKLILWARPLNDPTPPGYENRVLEV